MKLLREGKVKDVYEVSEDELLFGFSNRISVFDKIIPSDVPRKGESLCRTAAFWFQQVEDAGICQTHFLGLESPEEMRVRRVQVIPDYDQLDEETTSYLIPLEVVCRHFAAGSLMDRIEKGKVDPVDLGFPEGHEITAGERLPEPFVEFTTKLEPVDRKLTEDQALEISGLTEDELAELEEAVLAIDQLIEDQVEPRGLIHADGKKEFAFDEDRQLMVVDTFGTGDEDRFWDKQAYEEDGRVVEFSKEFVRQHYRQTGYHAELMKAREQGQPEPEIPAMPEDLIDQTSKLYADLYEEITGDTF